MERNIKIKFYNIKDNFKITLIMVLEYTFYKLVISMKVNFKMIKQIDNSNIHINVEVHTNVL
jgi:hypothetical protein